MADRLQIVTEADLETLPVGLYSLGKREVRRYYNAAIDTFETGPCELLGRVRSAGQPMPKAFEKAQTRADGGLYVIDWCPVASMEPEPIHGVVLQQMVYDDYPPAPTWRLRLREWWHDTRESLRVLGLRRHIWHTHLYRPLSRLAHRFDLHHMPKRQIQDGDEQTERFKCTWCGLCVTRMLTGHRFKMKADYIVNPPGPADVAQSLGYRHQPTRDDIAYGWKGKTKA